MFENVVYPNIGLGWVGKSQVDDFGWRPSDQHIANIKNHIAQGGHKGFHDTGLNPHMILCLHTLQGIKKRPVSLQAAYKLQVSDLLSHFPFATFDGVNGYHAVFQVTSFGEADFTCDAVKLAGSQFRQVFRRVA